MRILYWPSEGEPGGSGNSNGVENNTPPAGGESGDGEDPGGDPGDAAKLTLTQAQLDALIEKRIRRSRASWEKEYQEKAERESMSEAERLKAELEDERKRAQSIQAEASRSLARAAALRMAVSQGIDANKAERALRLVDLDQAIDDNGAPDEDVIKAELTKLLDDFPELKANASASVSRGGSEHAPGNRKPLTKEDVAKMPASELQERWSEVEALFAKK